MSAMRRQVNRTRFKHDVEERVKTRKYCGVQLLSENKPEKLTV